MANQLDAFVAKAREKGLNDDQIREKLQNAGWQQASIDDALDDLAVPVPDELVPPVPSTQAPQAGSIDRPISVVNNLSVRGFEYSIMFLSLLISASSTAVISQIFINDLFDKANGLYEYGGVNEMAAFMITLLLVAFPIFAFLFLRLKKAELADPSLLQDPSRRRWSQFTQLVTFLVSIGYIVSFIYVLITPSRTGSGPDVLQQLLRTVSILVITGGVFAYYWYEDHRSNK